MSRPAAPQSLPRQFWIAAALLLLIVAGALLTPAFSPWTMEEMDWEAMEAPPSAAHWFGTDQVGRDLLTRTMAGARVSLTVAVIAISVSLCIGVPWGLVAGYLGGRVDQVMMRTVDALYSLPLILVVILLVVVFGRNQYLLFMALGALFWMDIARIVRGQTLRVRQAAYIEAARSMGAPTWHLLRRHVLPNVSGPVVVYATLALPGVILAESFISFLGLGIQEPATSLGVLVADGTQVMESSPWLVIFPGVCLGMTVWSCNTMGDRLRDRLDRRDNPGFT